MITGLRMLAKTSGTPGKTRLINHFLVNEKWYLVDLPGIGYARSPLTERSKWEKMIASYLLTRTSLMNTFVLVDSRLQPATHFDGHNSDCSTLRARPYR